MKTTRMFMAFFLVVSGFLMSSCSGPTVDETKPIAEIETEADEMTADELRRMAEAYRKAIMEKQKDIKELRETLSEKKANEFLSNEATAIAADADALATSLEALIERFDLYVDLLKKEGGDTAGLGLD